MSSYKKSDVVLLIITGFWGFAGVILLAAGAHADGTGRMTSAGTFLLFHAAAATGLIGSAILGPRFKLNTLLLLLVGSGVFAADLVSRATRGEGLLPNLAPTGGTLTMLGWLGVAIGAALKLKSKA
ncbi:MAG: hypothetical protein QM645_14620 [Asticcacaulis sp.]